MRSIFILFFIYILGQLTAQQVTQVKLRDLEDGLNERIVNKIARDTFGYFYLFSNNSIQRYDGSEFENVDIPLGAEKLLRDVSCVGSDNKGGLLLYANNHDQVLHISPASLTSSYISLPHSHTVSNNKLELGDASIKYVIRDQDTIVASRGSFWKYIDGNLSQLGYNDIEGYNCNAMTQDNYGNIIAAFGHTPNESDSIFVLRSSGELSDYTEVLRINDKIKDIYCDDIDHRWMVATFNGLYIVSFKRTGIEVFHDADMISSSSFGHVVLGVSASGPDVLFADENYGLRRINETGEVELLFPDETVDFFDNRKIYYDSVYSKYYMTANYTDDETILYITDTSYSELKKQILPFRVNDFIVTDKDELLIAGINNLISEIDVSGRIMLWNTQTSSGKMLVNNIPVIRSVESVGDHYWVGSSNGLFVYNQSFEKVQKLEAGISNPHILCVREIGSKVYVGSYGGGLYVLDKTSKAVTAHYSKSTFLSDNIVAAIEEDDQGHVWLGTFNGINVLDKNGLIISKIMDYDGISHREMNTDAISKDDQGNIYFGTLNGVTKLNPDKVLNWSTSYGLHIASATAYYNKNVKVIDINNTPIPIEQGFDSLLIKLDFPNYIRTLFDTPLNYLRVNDKASNALSRDYKQLLISPSELNSDPTLVIRSSNNDSKSTLVFSPKYNYTTGIITTLILLCSVGILLVMFYRRKIVKVESEQDQKIEINKRVAELELSALQSQMNPHFIFNALGAIQYFIQTQKTEEADNFLSDFAMLMRKILESSKTKYITLKEEKEILDLYINLEQLRFEGLFDFNWHIDDNVDMDMIIPPMILQPFIENAINHGLFSLKGRKGKLDVFIIQKSEYVIECIIRDNGIGRKQADQLRNKKHKPRGMQIVNDRIKTLNSLSDIKVNIRTTDLYENTDPSGTTAAIEIRYNSINF